MALRELLERIMQRSEPAPLPHVQIRYVAATKRENRDAKLKQVAVYAQLKRYVEETTPEDRRLETETAITALRAVARSVGQGSR